MRLGNLRKHRLSPIALAFHYIYRIQEAARQSPKAQAFSDCSRLSLYLHLWTATAIQQHHKNTIFASQENDYETAVFCSGCISIILFVFARESRHIWTYRWTTKRDYGLPREGFTQFRCGGRLCLNRQRRTLQIQGKNRRHSNNIQHTCRRKVHYRTSFAWRTSRTDASGQSHGRIHCNRIRRIGKNAGVTQHNVEGQIQAGLAEVCLRQSGPIRTQHHIRGIRKTILRLQAGTDPIHSARPGFNRICICPIPATAQRQADGQRQKYDIFPDGGRFGR